MCRWHVHFLVVGCGENWNCLAKVFSRQQQISPGSSSCPSSSPPFPCPHHSANRNQSERGSESIFFSFLATWVVGLGYWHLDSFMSTCDPCLYPPPHANIYLSVRSFDICQLYSICGRPTIDGAFVFALSNDLWAGHMYEEMDKAQMALPGAFGPALGRIISFAATFHRSLRSSSLPIWHCLLWETHDDISHVEYINRQKAFVTRRPYLCKVEYKVRFHAGMQKIPSLHLKPFLRFS